MALQSLVDNHRCRFELHTRDDISIGDRASHDASAAACPPLHAWTNVRPVTDVSGLDSDHAERVLGHVIGGVRETYDRYEYLDEKREALTMLSNFLQEIISKPKTTSNAAVDAMEHLAAA
jgi:hypothetical protein